MLLRAASSGGSATSTSSAPSAPAVTSALQRVVCERLDEALDWLESLGAPVVERETGNPLTTGLRFDPRGLTEALVRAAGRRAARRRRRPTPLDVATGGFQGGFGWSRARRASSAAAAAGEPWSRATGSSSASSAALSSAGDWTSSTAGQHARRRHVRPRSDFVPLAQLYGRYARDRQRHGEEFFDRAGRWSETDLVQATARQPGARAWYVLDDARARRAGSRAHGARDGRGARAEARSARPRGRRPASPCCVQAGDHAHDRRPAHRRARPASTGAERPLRGRRRRGRDLDGRLRERAGGGARPRPHRGRRRRLR